jgi:hypothetical protein
MPRYFFHFRSGADFQRDSVGIVLDNASQALDCALELATVRITNPDLLCDWGNSAFEIEAETGGEVLILSMASVLANPDRGQRSGHRWMG